MIGKLKGIIDSLGENSAIIDVGGVGYLVYLSSRAREMLTPGQGVTFFVETHVREDHIHLYGFLSEEEKSWFNLLGTVQGVGAKMALALLASFSPAELLAAIHAKDTKMLTRANGVGPKLAERIVIELKNKAGNVAAGSVENFIPAKGKTAVSTQPLEEAVSALVNLGYGRTEAYTAVSLAKQKKTDAKLDEMITLGLRELAR